MNKCILNNNDELFSALDTSVSAKFSPKYAVLTVKSVFLAAMLLDGPYFTLGTELTYLK